MGYKQLRTSDLTGEIIEDDKVLTVSVAGKVFDCTGEELKALKTVDNLVELDVRDVGGQSWKVYATKAEFGKLVNDEKLESFDNVRGRRTGYRPNGS
jgi:hypothetical protein